MRDRRSLLVMLGAGALAAASLAAPARQAPDPLDAGEWRLWRARFATPEGRVVDDGNGGISHSEGQAYGMLLAVAFGDAATFARLWRWTRGHLQVRDDRLFAWKWDPTAPGVADRNSAADGDLLIAWALARAAEAWGEPAYRAEARAIAADILDRLVWPAEAGPVLLPGPLGFVHDGVPTVNLSYWVFPALRELDAVLPSPRWRALGASGLALLHRARFGPAGLPPDWLQLTEPPRPAPGFAPVFGYNAVRIPLHLVWGGIEDRALLRPYLDHAAAYGGHPPATLDLESGARSPEPVSAGGQAVFALAAAAATRTRPALPGLEPAMDYFAASLLLLAKVAYAERFRS